MALTSPGVEVTVIDESFYTPAEPGTVPLIIVASRQNKTSSSGASSAQGTLKANAGKIYTVTSQRELADLFGDPTFVTDTNNNPIHASELNEYGLQAAYSFLGVSSRAYVVRADVDLGELEGSANPPDGAPSNGQLWLDTATTEWGIFEWNGDPVTATNGQTFVSKTPTYVLTSADQLTGGEPKPSIGRYGDYAVVAYIDQDVATTRTNMVSYWYKNRSGSWAQIGSKDWASSWAAAKSSANPVVGAGNIKINDQMIDTGSSLATLASNINANASLSAQGITAAVVDTRLEIYSNADNDAVGDSELANAVVIAAGTLNPTTLGIPPGTYYGPKMTISKHTQVPEYKSTDTRPRPSGSVWIKTTSFNLGADYKVRQFSTALSAWSAVPAPMYSTASEALYYLDQAGGGLNVAVGSTFVQTNAKEHSGYDATPADASFHIYRRAVKGITSATSEKIQTGTLSAGAYSVTIRESVAGSMTMSSDFTWTITCAGTTGDAATIAAALSGPDDSNNVPSALLVEVDLATNKVVVKHKEGGELHIKDTDSLFADMGFAAFDFETNEGTANFYDAPAGDTGHDYRISNWKLSAVTSSAAAPTTLVEDGRLWYDTDLDDVDIMVHDGTTWIGYQNYSGFTGTDPNGPIVAASEPLEQSDGTALVTGDIWIDTSDVPNYPVVKRYNSALQIWTTIDTSDQTTENGIVFADARWAVDGETAEGSTIVDLLTSDHLDPDAPDPDLYPRGMMLFNTRRSGFNVKRFVKNHIDTGPNSENPRMGDASMVSYYPHRWVTESANDLDGSGSFGSKAQRKVVVQALQALVNSNENLRDDNQYQFNLMACPSYPELIGEMQTLNVDRGITSFIIGDTPMTLANDATTLLSYLTNAENRAQDDQKAIVTRDEYLGVFYPSGFTSDNFGNDVVVPASHMILRQFALSDQVSRPWFAPAGTRRGNITNATSVGYVNGEGEFVPVSLNEGQRDTLYINNVNPIVVVPGSGPVTFGQKTRAATASALDRINVARLVIYLRSQLNKLAKPYIFEPNDKITRDEIKNQVEGLLLELVGLRGIYDFLVVCDETNNTPTRIDRNELYVDVAIEPVKAVEFIYIPIRLKNTGELANLG